MKKALIIALALVLCLSVIFVACDKKENDGKAPASELERAKVAVEKLYKDSIPADTAADYKVSKFVPLDGMYSYPITWTVNNSAISVVSVDDKNVMIDVPEETPEAINYVLTATVKADDGSTATVEFSRTVPAFKLYTYAEYAAAKAGTTIVIDGVVTGILPKGNGATNMGIYMNTYDAQGNPDGGVYVYQSPDEYPEGLAVGTTIRVAGVKDIYSGTHEVKNATVTIKNSAVTPAEPVDFTQIYKDAADLKAATLVEKQAMLVTVKGVEIGKTGGSDGSYYYFKLDGKESYIRVSSSSCPLTTAEQETFKTFFDAHEGYTADVTGVICVYSGAFYLTPVSATPFTNEFMPVYTEEQKVERTKSNLEVTNNITEDTELTLPLVSSIHNDVTISWTVSQNDCAVLNAAEGKLTVTLPETATTIKLTATINCGTAHDTKEFDVLIDAATTQEYLPKAIDAPTAGTYKFALFQAKLGQWLYSDGTVNADGRLVTTDKAAKAADFVLAADGAGYTIKVGDKFLELDANHKVVLVDAKTATWAFDAQLGVFTWTIETKVYYLGTYNNFNTISASETRYISGDNAANVGVSQFPAYLSTLAEADWRPVGIEEAKAGTYKFALFQAKLGQWLYSDGTVNADGRLVTTDKAAKAADFVLAADGAGYTIKVGDKFLELDANHKVVLVDAKTATWAFDAQLGVFTWTIETKVYYLGTYNNFNTISASETRYISGDNAANVGVSQFPAYLSNLVLVETEFKPIDAATAGTYKFGLYQAKLGQNLYSDGTVNADGRLVTTDKYEKAADFVLAADGAGYTIKVGDKFLELDANHKVVLVDAKTATWAFDAQLGVFTWTIETKVYYLGTYNNFNTISASETRYISGDNAANVGVSQFPAHLGVKGFVEAEVSPEEIVADAKAELNIPNQVTENITLPATVGDVQVSWASSNTAVIANDGTVVRGAEDVEVTLTATLSFNGVSDTKVFTVKVIRDGVVVVKYSGTTTNMEADQNNAALVGLDAEKFTVSTAKNDATNEVGLNAAGQIRLYNKAGSENGCAMTVTSTENIVKIKITFAQNADKASVLVNGQAVTADADGYYTINAQSFTIQHTSNETKSAQVWISQIEIEVAQAA